MNRLLSILKFLLIAFFLLLPIQQGWTATIVSADSSFQSPPNRPQVAVVLAGGGAKGFSEIGVLKVLEKEGIPIDIVVGTSIGSIVGGLYATGYSAEQIEQKCREQDWSYVLSDRVPRRYLSENKQMIRQRYVLTLPLTKKNMSVFSLPQSMIRGQNVINLFCELTAHVPEDIDFTKDLKRKYACVATDFATGEKVVLTQGSLPTAMYSSMAIPAAFEPSLRDGRLLVDGGIVDNFPIDIAHLLGADIIIGVDIRTNLLDKESIDNMIDVAGQLMTLYDPVKQDEEIKQCQLIIRPDLTGYGVSSFYNEAVDTIIKRGELAALAALPDIRNLKQTYNLSTSPNSATKDTFQTKWLINKVHFKGNTAVPYYVLRNDMRLKLPDSLSAKDIKRAIDKAYGVEPLDKLFYSLAPDSSGDGHSLTFHASERRSVTRNIGFRVNNVDAAAILLNMNARDYTKRFGLISGSVELSANPAAELQTELHYKDFPVFGFDIKGKMRQYAICGEEHKLSSADLWFAQANVYAKSRFFHVFDTELGYRLKFYWSELFLDPKLQSPDFERNALVGQPYLRLSLDTYDHYYFPTGGSNIVLEASTVSNLLTNDKFTPILLGKARNVIPVIPNNRVALLLDGYVRIIMGSDYLPVFESNFVGGTDYSVYFEHHLPFQGLKAINMTDNATFMGLAGVRYRFYKKHYLYAKINMLYTANDVFDPTSTKTIYGAALSYGLNTLLGPLDFSVGYSPEYDAPVFNANFGFWF